MSPILINPYRFGGGGGGFQPSDLASCKLWCHPTSGFFSDHDGTTSQSTNGGNVRWWQSAVGGTNVIGLQRRSTAPNDGNPPTLDTGTTLNGLSGLRYTAASSQLSIVTYDPSAESALELFLVMKTVADPAASLGTSGIHRFSGGSDFESHYPFTDGNVYLDFGTSVRKSCGNPSVALTSGHIHDCWSASGDWALLINNSSVFSTGTNTQTFGALPWIGASKNLDAYMDGWLWEVIIFNAKLSSGDRTSVYGYLSTKYGI